LEAIEEKKEDEDAEGKVAWNKKNTETSANRNERMYPSLAKSLQHASAVAARNALGDDNKGIETSKNAFAALNKNNAQSDSDDDAPKQQKKGMFLQKKKGETEKVALQRAKKDGKEKDEKCVSA